MAKKTKLAVHSNSTADNVKDIDLLTLARRSYKNYGVAVLEDRAFPDYRDGFTPVNRRLLWAAHQMGLHSRAKSVKSARVVGDAMGRYHPHGDLSLYSALVKMTNANTPVAMFEGEGNWGSLSDKSFAAMRYTETKLSKFSDEVIFNKFYTPVIDFVDNYDSSSKEPLLLPTLLPIALISGKFGIAPGAQTNIPACEYKSILKCLHGIYSGEELTPKYLYKTLKFRSTYGGVELPPADEEAKAHRVRVFKTSEGKATIQSVMTYNEASHTVTVEGFARDTDMEKLLTGLNDVAGIKIASDDSSTKDYYGRLTIVFQKGLKDIQYKKLLSFVRKELSSRESYILNFTERYADDKQQSQANVVPMSITAMLTKWLEWRVALEKKACQYWITEDEKTIRKLELLILAVDNRKLIIQSLDRDGTQEDLNKWLAKKLKIKPEEAHFIYQLRVMQLRRLEKTSLTAQMKQVHKNKKGLESRKKNPHPHMAEQLKDWVKLGVIQ